MKRLVFMGGFVGALAAATAFAQSGNTALGTVHLAKKVMADGKPLAAGTYQVRLTSDEPKPVSPKMSAPMKAMAASSAMSARSIMG